jgi:hypothetical protein
MLVSLLHSLDGATHFSIQPYGKYGFRGDLRFGGIDDGDGPRVEVWTREPSTILMAALRASILLLMTLSLMGTLIAAGASPSLLPAPS